MSEQKIEHDYRLHGDNMNEVYPSEYDAALDMPENLTDHPCYWVWANMKRRCSNKNHKAYRNYGGRGITVCDEWYQSSWKFIHWSIMNGWEKGLELDRIDNDKGYCPDNCRYIDKKTNRRNTQLLSRANTSGFRGVRFHKLANKWHARGKYDGKEFSAGYADTALDAAILRDRYVVENNLDLPLNFADHQEHLDAPEIKTELEQWLDNVNESVDTGAPF